MRLSANFRVWFLFIAILSTRAAAAESSFDLTYIVKLEGTRTQVVRLDPRGTDRDVLQRLDHRPALVVWRLDSSAVISVGPDGVLATDLSRRPFLTSKIGDAPPGGIVARDGWIDTDGRSIVIVGGRRNRDGTPGCSLYDNARRGTWRERTETARVRGEEACESLTNALRLSRLSASNADVLARAPCGAVGSVCDAKSDQINSDLSARLRGANVSIDFPTVVDPGGSDWFLVIDTSQGDNLHLMGVVYAVSRRSAAVRSLMSEAGRQVQVTVKGHLVLIADEYSGDDPRVFDLDKGQEIFRAKGSAAVWIPFRH